MKINLKMISIFFFVPIFVLIFFFFYSPGLSYAKSSNELTRKSAINAELDFVQRHYSEYEARVHKGQSMTKNAAPMEPPHLENQFYVKPPIKSGLKPMVHQSENKLKYHNEYLNVQLQILGGYRQDEFNWNIAGDVNGENPNILSELTWEDLQMSQITAKNRITLFDTFVIDVKGSYADIYRGKNQDSDYFGDNRTFEFSRSNNQSNDGEATDVAGAFGMRFSLRPNDNFLDSDNVWLTLLGGYSRHELNLIITDGFQTIPAVGAFDGLHNNYSAEWKGPFAGIELEAKQKKLSGFMRYEYHWADYYGSANWNLRPEFVHPLSFEHIAEGKGVVFNLGGGYQITDWWSVNLEGTIQWWNTKPGIDRLFFTNGTVIESQLNRVNWNSYEVMLGTTLALF